MTTTDPLLVLLRKYEQQFAASDAAAGDTDDGKLAQRLYEASVATMRKIVKQKPPATTPAGACAALDHMLADYDMWNGADEYLGEMMLRHLIIAARDYLAVVDRLCQVNARKKVAAARRRPQRRRRATVI